MANAIDDAEGIMGIAAIAVVLLLIWWLANKLGLLGSGSGTDAGLGIYPNSPFSPLQNVNGVSGVAALLQRGISYFSGQPANQIFGPNSTGIASDTWWNNLWKYFDPFPPQTSFDYSQAVDSFDASGEAGAANSTPDATFAPPPAVQNFINSMGWQS